MLEDERSPAAEASSWPSDRRGRRAAEDEEVAVRWEKQLRTKNPTWESKKRCAAVITKATHKTLATRNRGMPTDKSERGPFVLVRVLAVVVVVVVVGAEGGGGKDRVDGDSVGEVGIISLGWVGAWW